MVHGESSESGVLITLRLLMPSGPRYPQPLLSLSTPPTGRAGSCSSAARAHWKLPRVFVQGARAVDSPLRALPHATLFSSWGGCAVVCLWVSMWLPEASPLVGKAGTRLLKSLSCPEQEKTCQGLGMAQTAVQHNLGGILLGVVSFLCGLDIGRKVRASPLSTSVEPSTTTESDYYSSCLNLLCGMPCASLQSQPGPEPNEKRT